MSADANAAIFFISKLLSSIIAVVVVTTGCVSVVRNVCGTADVVLTG